MNKLDADSLNAYKLAKVGKVADANDFLDQFAAPEDKDNRPFFYWMARAEVARQNKDVQGQAHGLYMFSTKLSARKRHLLGYNKPGTHDASDLTRNEPAEIVEVKKSAFQAYREEAYEEAVPLYQKAIDLEIEDLKSLEDDIYK